MTLQLLVDNLSEYGSKYDEKTKSLNFNIYSKNATYVEIYFYDQPTGEDEKVNEKKQGEFI